MRKPGRRAMKSRIGAGVYCGCADTAVFSQQRIQMVIFRIADFQRSCWKVIRAAKDFPISQSSCGSLCAHQANPTILPENHCSKHHRYMGKQRRRCCRIPTPRNGASNKPRTNPAALQANPHQHHDNLQPHHPAQTIYANTALSVTSLEETPARELPNTTTKPPHNHLTTAPPHTNRLCKQASQCNQFG